MVLDRGRGCNQSRRGRSDLPCVSWWQRGSAKLTIRSQHKIVEVPVTDAKNVSKDGIAS